MPHTTAPAIRSVCWRLPAAAGPPIRLSTMGKSSNRDSYVRSINADCQCDPDSPTSARYSPKYNKNQGPDNNHVRSVTCLQQFAYSHKPTIRNEARWAGLFSETASRVDASACEPSRWRGDVRDWLCSVFDWSWPLCLFPANRLPAECSQSRQCVPGPRRKFRLGRAIPAAGKVA